MNGAALGSVVALATAWASTQEETIVPEDVAFLELSSPRATYFEQEPFRLTLRFGIEEAFSRSLLVQLTSRELDVPVEVEAAWIDELPGAARIPRERQDAPGSSATFVLDGEIARAPRVSGHVRQGRPFLALELEETYVARAPGALVVPAASLRFAYATRFEQDFFGERVPADRRIALVAGAPLELRIEPLPADGRPRGFTNAVGRFEVSADAQPRELVAGGTVRLVLCIEGDGNFDVLEVPQLALAGFHVLGSVEERSGAGLTVTHDLMPLGADVHEVPAIEFPHFVPGDPPGYRIARTEPIALVVHPGPGERSADVTSDGSRTEGTGERASDRWRWFAAGAGTALLAAALVLGVLRRRRTRLPADPLVERARRAAALFRESSRDGSGAAAAYTEYLAARLGGSTAAVITPDLARQLVTRGASEDLAFRAAHALERIVAARYGGPGEVSREELAGLVDELDAVLASRARSVP